VLNACQDAGVRIFVYTSSSSVVWSGQNLSGPNEDEIQIPEEPYAIYAHSKGLAEKMVCVFIFLSRKVVESYLGMPSGSERERYERHEDGSTTTSWHDWVRTVPPIRV
jgi:hypothetical protein